MTSYTNRNVDDLNIARVQHIVAAAVAKCEDLWYIQDEGVISLAITLRSEGRQVQIELNETESLDFLDAINNAQTKRIKAAEELLQRYEQDKADMVEYTAQQASAAAPQLPFVPRSPNSYNTSVAPAATA